MITQRPVAAKSTCFGNRDFMASLSPDERFIARELDKFLKFGLNQKDSTTPDRIRIVLDSELYDTAFAFFLQLKPIAREHNVFFSEQIEEISEGDKKDALSLWYKDEEGEMTFRLQFIVNDAQTILRKKHHKLYRKKKGQAAVSVA